MLVRALKKETRNSVAHRELVRSLEELTGVFYTEKAQNLFAVGEAVAEAKPKEALDSFQEALRVEDGNITVLKAVARAHLRLADCGRAELAVTSAGALNPYSAELRLLRLQILNCQKKWERLTVELAAAGTEADGTELFLKGLIVKDLLQRREFKKAKAALVSWEAQAPDYPELHYWKWQLSEKTATLDRASALKYVQLCQNLTPRKRKSFNLDVDLCKGKETVDAFLKESGFEPSAPSEGATNGVEN